MPSSAPPEVDDDLDEVLDIEPRSRSSDRRRRRRDRRSGRPEAVHRWQASEDDQEPWDDVVDDGATPPRQKTPVFWRARDSLYFEPLVALAIIVVLLVSLFAYTSNWPPVYVVESNSMQHGSGDHLGVLNAGDIVLVQKASMSSIITLVDGLRTGFSTYGLPGDVIVYQPNGSSSATPIVHRAIIYLQYDASNSTYNASGLSGLSCGPGASHDYYAQGTVTGCQTTGLSPGDTLFLYHVGGRAGSVTIPFNPSTDTQDLGTHSGFLTLGDNNSNPDQLPPSASPLPLSNLVEPGWVIGVARGLIPWFGALKLLLDGNAGKVPAASWEFLGLTVAGVIFAAAGLHILSKRSRERRARPRDRYDEEEDEGSGEAAPKASRGSPGMRPWQATGDPPDTPTATSPGRATHEARRRSHFVSSHDKRPGRRRPKDPRGSGETDD
jgi:signal peptidase I